MTIEPSDFGGLFSCQRILVVGANGAGKTWISIRLGERMDLPVFHNDALALRQDWQRWSPELIVTAQAAVLDQNSWILEGGPSILTDNALSRAQIILWLDMPRGLRVGRIIWRSLRFMGQTRPEHPAGNPDWPGRRQFRFISKAWQRDDVMRHTIQTRIGDRPVMRLTSAKAVRDLI